MNRVGKFGGRMATRIFRGLAWLGSHEFSVLLSAVVLSAGVWVFIELADEVTENEAVSIDEAVLLSLRNAGDLSDPVGPGWVEEMGRDFTALGSMGVLTLITLAVLGYLLLAGRNRTSLFTLLAVAGGMLLSTLLKMGFDRARPDLVPHDTVVYTASFPSGHSMMAAVTYLTLAAILSRVHSSPLLKAYLLITAAVITLLVGASRVYLGVHWPTDVLAGWAAGAAWASLCWLIARGLQRRHMVEEQDSEGL
ncbi:MAG TPA: phosphatase PAP2 family protein [Woeseiaceae bacterium]|nr:phosphatase PAP2 family protein [Woeseiaceae bacterium]